MDCKELVDRLKSPTWQDIEDPDSSLLTDAATAITDLLARAEEAEAANSQLDGTVTTLMESNKKLADALREAEKERDEARQDCAIAERNHMIEVERREAAETRCKRLEEARENANEACAKWEGMYHMAEQERDTYKAALQNWHEEG